MLIDFEGRGITKGLIKMFKIVNSTERINLVNGIKYWKNLTVNGFKAIKFFKIEIETTAMAQFKLSVFNDRIIFNFTVV